MTYLLDTNVILYLVRKYEPICNLLFADYQIFEADNDVLISIVSLGETESFMLRRKWGEAKQKAYYKLLEELLIVDINKEDIIQRYAEIDTFSQGKLEEKPLFGSARNMGKNDLWIAATASVLNANLLTTDKDFSHLDNHFLTLNLVRL